MKKEQLQKRIEGLLPIHPQILSDNNGILAGGALTSLYTRKEINDFDIYFRTKEDYLNALRDVKEEHDFVYVLAHTNKAIMFTTKMGGEAIQFIHNEFYNHPTDIFNNFDFYINMAAYDFKSKELYLHDKFLTNIAARCLEFNPNTLYPIISALRVDKYKERGYIITKKEFIKIMLAINNLNIKSWEDFKDQISGLYGEKLDLNIDYKSEFSVDKALEIVEAVETDIYKKDYNIEEGKETDVEVIIEKEKMNNLPEYPKFYKCVSKVLKSLYGGFNRSIEYKLGSVVNGGTNGIYVHSLSSEKELTYWGNERHIIELQPVDKFDVHKHIISASNGEIQLGGDWKVTKVMTKEEYDAKE